MTRTSALVFSALLTLMLAASLEAAAQEAIQPQPVAATSLTAAQLDQLLAPIALYPDTLLAQILMAATYPLEIVQADRWLQEPDHAALAGEPLTAALEQQSWEPSVKSLIPFPQILHMMDDNLTWTEQLGDAFLEGQSAVMDAVQRLRRRAQAAGTLHASPYDNVTAHDSVVAIESLGPDIVYVPVYDPFIVYGMWPYPDFPPYYFTGYLTVIVIAGPGFGWFGFPLNPPLWQWCRWDWERHVIDVDAERFNSINRRQPPVVTGPWHHDPAHRHGVPYRDAEARQRFLGERGMPGVHRSYRGYPPPATPQPSPAIVQPLPQVVQPLPPVVHPLPQVMQPLSERERESPRTGLAPGPPQGDRVPASPAFESFGRGREVRAEAERGSASRRSMPMPTGRRFENLQPAPPGGVPPGTGQGSGARMQPRSGP